MALNFQAPTERNPKLYELSHTEVLKKCFSYSNYRRVCLSPDTQVRRKESLTFQGSSDHEEIASLPNFKQVETLPIPGTPFLTLPDTDGFRRAQLCLLLFLCQALGKWPISEIFHFLTSNASPVWLHANHGKTPPHPRFLITDTQLKSNHVFPKLRHSLLPFRKSLSRAQLRNGLSALAPHHPAFPNRSLPSMAVSF